MDKPAHEFASTQVGVPEPHASRLANFARSIPEAEIDPADGREADPHVTVKYGLHSDTPDAVASIVAGENPPTLSLGRMSIFPASKDRNSDVLKVDVHSPELHRLNRKIADGVKHTDTHPDYHPHLTLAYLKPGEGAKYVGGANFDGVKFQPEHVVFSGKDGTKTKLPFGGGSLAASDSDESLLLGACPLTDFSAALTLGSTWDWPKERGGKPCLYYWKESLPANRDFFDAKGRRWNFTGEDIDKAIDTLRLARSKGYEPAAPSSHKLDGRNYGYVVDARKNSRGNLELLHQFIGQDAADEALAKKSSICIRPRVTAADGTEYVNLIDHNAILPNPQLTDLTDFQPALAASGQAARAVVLNLAAPQSQEPAMDLTKIRKLTGAAENATDEQVLTLAAEQLGTLATLKGEKAELSRQLDGTKLELSRSGPAKPTPRELSGARRLLAEKRDKAIAGGLSAAFADKLEKRYIPTGIDLATLTLSREADDDDHLILKGIDTATDVYEALEGLKIGHAADGKSKSGSQGLRETERLALGNEDDPNSEAEKKELRERVKARMAKTA